jgi:hypothetical protein
MSLSKKNLLLLVYLLIATICMHHALPPDIIDVDDGHTRVITISDGTISVKSSHAGRCCPSSSCHATPKKTASCDKASPWTSSKGDTPAIFANFGAGLGQTFRFYDNGYDGNTAIPTDLRLRVGFPISNKPFAITTDFAYRNYEIRNSIPFLNEESGLDFLDISDKYTHFTISPGLMFTAKNKTFVGMSVGLALGEVNYNGNGSQKLDPGISSGIVAGFHTGYFRVGMSYSCTHNKINGDKLNSHTIGMFVDLLSLRVSFRRSGGGFEITAP